MNKESYTAKSHEYFFNVRRDIISLIEPDPSQKILEVGAGGGNTLLYIKENGLAGEVMGVELMEIAGSNQQHDLINKFQVANIEEQDIDAEKEYFDVIICADVLEHLIDPWKALIKIVSHLKNDGMLILSMPNIRQWKVVAKIILKGDFGYTTQGGIMDKTHLRFFCKKNILELIKSSALIPIYIQPNFKLKILQDSKRTRIINRLTLGLFENFLTVQYLVIAKKK